MKLPFCIECCDRVEFEVKEEVSELTVRGIKFSAILKRPICKICKDDLYIPDIHDENIDRLEKAYQDKLKEVNDG